MFVEKHITIILIEYIIYIENFVTNLLNMKIFYIY